MTKCEVIIVRYGLPEMEQECVDSVLKHTTDVDYHLTDHDNYEADEGLAKVWNALIRASDAEYICLLNNDTRVEAAWLSKLLEVFEDAAKLGAVGPMTNCTTGPQGKEKHRTKEKVLLPTNYPLTGFCLVFPKRIWEEVEGFDEAYEIYGEDSDFLMKVRELGYKWLIRTDVFVFHHGKASTSIAIARGKDLMAMKKRSKERYLSRWHKK
jgi:GT2 family glycosyltransferase